MSSQNQDLLDALAMANIIIINNNIAVALKYDEAVDLAPVITAKGIQKIALRIEAIGRENGVPIVDNPFVADSLYSSSEVGEYIPDRLYAHVAEIMVNIDISKKSSLNSD